MLVVGVVGRPAPSATGAGVVVARSSWVLPSSPTVRAMGWLQSNQNHSGAASGGKSKVTHFNADQMYLALSHQNFSTICSYNNVLTLLKSFRL